MSEEPEILCLTYTLSDEHYGRIVNEDDAFAIVARRIRFMTGRGPLASFPSEVSLYRYDARQVTIICCTVRLGPPALEWRASPQWLVKELLAGRLSECWDLDDDDREFGIMKSYTLPPVFTNEEVQWLNEYFAAPFAIGQSHGPMLLATIGFDKNKGRILNIIWRRVREDEAPRI